MTGTIQHIPVAIQLHDVSFRYAESNQGVFHVNLAVERGSCVALIGKSGCGKSTITRLINGLAPGFYKGELAGAIEVDGTPLTNLPSFEIARRVGSVFQDPRSQFFSSELAGEVAFACENLGFSQAEIRQSTNAAIQAFGVERLRHQSLDVLSSGEAQRVAIASTAAPAPSIIVLDEPTANLDEMGIAQLSEILKQLKAEGYTLVVAEHRLSWLHGLADRYLLFEEGELVQELTDRDLCAMSDTQRISCGLRSATPVRLSDFHNTPAEEQSEHPALAGESVGLTKHRHTLLQGVNIEIYPGHIHALTGCNGAGKTTLAKILSGLIRQTSGSVVLNGAPVRAHTRRQNVWFCSNNTATQFFTPSVEDELLLGCVPDDGMLERTRALLERLGIYEYRAAHPAALSGGQRQRLAIALAILSQRPVLIFDEPTSGLDAANMHVVAQELKSAAQEGRAILVITHDAEFVRACCTDVQELSKEESSVCCE